jgi:hypothetical protein
MKKGKNEECSQSMAEYEDNRRKWLENVERV